MKSTGITRRIDELGRIVIPKEIRRRLKISNGDLVDISVNEENIVLSKFHPLDFEEDTIKTFCDSIHQVFKIDIVITDSNKIVYSTFDNIKDLVLSDEFLKRVNSYIDKEISMLNKVNITKDFLINKSAIIHNININYEEYGYLIILDNIISQKHKDIGKLILDYLNKVL